MEAARGAGRCNATALPAGCLREDGVGAQRAADLVTRLLEATCRLCPALGDPRVAHDGALRECAGPACAPGGLVGPGTALETFGPCLDTTQDGGALADMALQVVSLPRIASLCPVAFWASYLVTLQYSVTTRPVDLPAGLSATADAHPFSDDGRFDLRPFPFWSQLRSLGEQLELHANFMSAHLLLCDDVHGTGPFRGKYVLRAGHDKPELHCATRSSDHQLIKRCRERRRSQWHSGMRGFALVAGVQVAVPPPRAADGAAALAALRCPTQEEQQAFARRRSGSLGSAWAGRSQAAIDKYSGRAAGSRGPGGRPGRGCEEPASEWRMDLRALHKCVLVGILERLQPAPGALVLDWGTGCGHKLTWASQLYDVAGLGLDIVAENVQWAERHSVGKFCQLDGRYVEWLPDDFFDAVLSYAALTHLAPDDQCRVVTELAGKVRVGGRLWFGWNAPSIHGAEAAGGRPEHHREEFWGHCFSTAAGQPRWSSGQVAIAWETVTEAYIFPDDFTRQDSYLFWPPAYSLFVTRTRGADAQGAP